MIFSVYCEDVKTKEIKMKCAAINEKGRAALIAWLEENLQESFCAKDLAVNLINKFDGSDINSNLHVELCSLKTVSGRPETYYFNNDELNVISEEE